MDRKFLNAGEPIIEFRDAYRTYLGNSPIEALKVTNLSIFRGDYVALMGPSGSGKSTLLNLMGLLDKPSGGELLIKGERISGFRDDEVAALRGANIGFVFQSFHLLKRRSCRQNVIMAMIYNGTPRASRAQRADLALQLVGLAHKVEALPSQLSGGERQRVAIARAVASTPLVLLCDEPTGNLDASSSQQVLELIDQLHSNGSTVVVVTHDTSVSSRARRQLRIADGVVSELQAVTR